MSVRWVESDRLPQARLGYPWTPLSALPRKVRDLAKRPLAESILLAQAILGVTPVSATKLIPGQRTEGTFGVGALASNVNVNNIRWRQYRRVGSGTKDGFGQHWGAMPFHHILDPTGASAGWSLIFHDYVRVDFASGSGWVAIGFVNANTSNDESTVVGAVWKCNSTDGYWTSGCYDGTSTATTLHETAHSGLTVSTARRLSVVIDAATKSVLWYADYELVDTFIPSSPIGQMAIPRIGYLGIANASADVKIQTVGGGNPRFFSIKPVA